MRLYRQSEKEGVLIMLAILLTRLLGFRKTEGPLDHQLFQLGLVLAAPWPTARVLRRGLAAATLLVAAGGFTATWWAWYQFQRWDVAGLREDYSIVNGKLPRTEKP